MLSINIKRSVVTVGVVAGLLAAAGPASAQGGGADFTRLASPGPHIATSEVFELHTFGSFDPVEHRGGNDTQLAAGGAHGLKPDSSTVAVESLKADSVGSPSIYNEIEHGVTGSRDRAWLGLGHEIDVEGLKADSNEVAVEGITLAHEGWRTPVDDMDWSIRGDDTITQARKPAHTVTMLDYMGSP